MYREMTQIPYNYTFTHFFTWRCLSRETEAPLYIISETVPDFRENAKQFLIFAVPDPTGYGE